MSARFDASVGQKLAIGFGVVIALVAVLGGVAIVASGRVRAAQERQTLLVAPRSEAADALELAVLNAAVAARTYVLTQAVAERSTLDRAMAALARRHEALAALAGDTDDRVLVEAFGPLLVDYQARLDAFVRLASSSAADAVWNRAEREAVAAREAALEKIRAYGTLQHEKSEVARAEVRTATSALVSSVGAVAVLVLVSGVLAASLVARSVRDPARRIVTAADALRRGDYEPALQLQPPAAGFADRDGAARFRDELVEAATVFGRMAVALRDREARLSAQARLSAVLAANLSPIEVASDALREMTAYVGAEVGVIYVAQAEGERADLLEALGTFALNRRLPPVRIGDGVAGQAAADQRTYVVHDIPPETPYVVDLGLEALRPRCVAAVPMTVGKRVLGVLVIGAVRDLSAEALGFLEESASQVAVSIDAALSHVHIESLATRLQEQNERLHAQNEELQAQGEELQAQSEELQAQNEELQAQGEELQVQADELLTRNARLADAEAHRDRFFAVLGHELRNPLSVIATAAKVLSGGSTAEAEAAARAIIERQIWRLGRLLDDLLDTARLSSGKIMLTRRPLDLGEAAAQAVETFARVMAPAQHDIRVDVRPAWIDADEARVEQIITNLVGNALKYTPPGGTVTVSVAPDGGTAVLRVADTGAGIRPEFLPRIFDAFAQDDPDRSGGLGLGLTLVKQLVALHGGTVDARSPGRGRGTTIEVRLPGSSAPAAVPAPAPPPPGAAPRRSVLIIEDNADARMMLAFALGRDGHVVHEAGDGPAGVAAAAAHRPDVALVDLDLPGFDGYEVARRLRHTGPPRLRLIAISGYGRAEDRRRALEAGFDDHLVKPIDLERVAAILRDAGA